MLTRNCNYRSFVRYFATAIIVVATVFLVAPSSVFSATLFSQTDSSSYVTTSGALHTWTSATSTLDFPLSSTSTVPSLFYQVYLREVGTVGSQDMQISLVRASDGASCYTDRVATSTRQDWLDGDWHYLQSEMQWLNNCSGTTEVKFKFYYLTSNSDVPDQADIATDVSGVPYFILSADEDDLVDTRTRIISIGPTSGQVIATTTDPFLFSAEVYINADDVYKTDFWGNNTVNPITITYDEPDLQTAFSSILPQNPVIVGQETTAFSTTTSTAGYQTFTWPVYQSDFYNLDRLNSYIGRHTSTVKIVDPSTFLWVWDTSSVLTSSSTVWTMVRLSGNDLLLDELEAVREANHASTTIDLSVCNLISGNFSFGSCFSALVKPNPMEIKATFAVLQDTVSHAFPFGYLTDFIDILNATSTATLPVIDAVIPAGVAGTGARAQLAFDPHMLDYVWNATTSQFTNESATSTETLFEIVSYYWDKIVYLLLFIYILNRLVGSHLFSSPYKKENI